MYYLFISLLKILQNISNLFVIRVKNAKLQSSRHMLKDEIRFLTCYGFFFLKAAQKLKAVYNSILSPSQKATHVLLFTKSVVAIY